MGLLNMKPVGILSYVFKSIYINTTYQGALGKELKRLNTRQRSF